MSDLPCRRHLKLRCNIQQHRRLAGEQPPGSGERGERTMQDQQQEEKVVAEFSHDELYSFFLDLEKMQEQIDALS